GRGSAAGSLVLNCLGCTNIIDPIESRLLFERFLDAERFRQIVEAGGQVSGADCPDVDSDWATPMHDVVKRHFIDVYGERCTASIGTRGTMKTKAVLKDLARLYDIPQAEINAVTKGIDSEWADNEENEVTVADLEARSPELKALLEKYPDFCRSFEEIRGTVSNWGVHAGGVLITDFDLTDQLPLRKDDDGRLVTCWTEGLSSRELGMMGFIKFDMLAIDQINIIDDTLRLIKQTRGKDIDWTEIPLGDYKALNQLNKHDGICVFQFDTALAAKVTDNMGGVKSFEDLGSLSTLMRPAALQNGFDKEFGLRRAGKSDGYVPDCLKQYLADTYGLPIYQEHIMQIAMALAGFDKVEAYSFMKKVYKGKVHGKEEKDEWRKKFVEGCRSKVESGEIPADYPDRCFDQIMAFLGYGFCKSHALSYSVYSALDLWLKAYYPLEFMCVNLSITDRAKEKKGVRLLDQRVRYCRSIGLKVSPADVRCSGDRWIIRDGGLIAPLSNLKGFGTNDV
ncbi:MAG: hypothetical protein J6Y62_02685, partial [Clostridia bacterium]|nr:hypothetical protein [Clostridia bacterium]